MLKGRIETTRTIFCPFCIAQEEEDECQQYHRFEFIEIRDDQFQIWECLKCNTIFQIDINEVRI